MQIDPLPEILSPSNLDECLSLWGGADEYSEAELATAVERVRLLLAAERARGRIVRDDSGRVRAFGVSAFVKRPIVDEMAALMQPHVGRRLLLRRDWNEVFLTTTEIGAGNAGSGLESVVLTQGYDETGLTDEEWAALLGTLLQAFQAAHAGFKILRIVNEAFGTRGVAFLSTAWRNVITFPPRSASAVPSAVLVVTRGEAQRQGGALLAMFVYRPPRLMLTIADQEVLRIALTGAPDTVIMAELRLTKPALTARWSRIHRRWDTAMQAPARASRETGTRGRQMRHLIIEYVRTHPSELTPFLR